MGLEKAMITNTVTGEMIQVMFNPETYSLSKSNNFQEVAVPGLESPIIQFTSGASKTLDLELFFDTYEEQVDVRVFTEKFNRLMKMDLVTKAPPVCLFSWGSLTFSFVLKSLQQTFQMFLPTGIPVRAKLNLNLLEYRMPGQELLENVLSAASAVVNHVAVAGERLSDIAAKKTGNPANWRKIAKANNIANPRLIEPGSSLNIPK